jgi:protein-S-isoprenylcysteine O-methyltransferase Ste14
MATTPEQATVLEQEPPKGKPGSKPVDTLFEIRTAEGGHATSPYREPHADRRKQPGSVVAPFTRWVFDADDEANPKLDRSREVSRLAKHAYLAGLAGTLTLLGMGFLASRRDVFGHGDVAAKGWGIGGGEFDVNLSMVFVLLVCSVVMFAVELAIRLDVDKGRLVKVAPELQDGRWTSFLLRCVLVYGVEVGLISLVFGFFKTASEYGFQSNPKGYYQPWFAVMPYFWKIYLYGGLPYVILTRALQHSPNSDRKQAAFATIKGLLRLYARITGSKTAAPPMDHYDRSAFLGLGVKIFFVPLMTIFFIDQFTHLVKNYDWMLGDGFAFGKVNIRDVHNVSHSVIFAVDVGLAWCGYVVSSRWIKNTLFSTEPTFLGWMMALFCYPPINRIPGFYYGSPGETEFFSITTPQAVAFFAICSIMSFAVYTSATVCFGLRFSNLTHRGIITTGPYALIRHPAYASKNFSWWCVMLPAVIYQVYVQKDAAPLLHVVGMVVMSGIYYMRAITEERHLARDPEYRLYMKKVPYRFIPGIL